VSDEGRGARAIMPREWVRLERATEEATSALGQWTRRAREAEDEVERLRQSLEEVAAASPGPDDLAETIRRLKAENAALRSRMLQARKRVAGLMQRLAALEVER
jgi:chromosome segregation ATPase